METQILIIAIAFYVAFYKATQKGAILYSLYERLFYARQFWITCRECFAFWLGVAQFVAVALVKYFKDDTSVIECVFSALFVGALGYMISMIIHEVLHDKNSDNFQDKN